MVGEERLAGLLERAEQEALHREPGWLALLHYERGWFPGESSRVHSAGFFLAEHGRSDPGAELGATLRALFAPSSQGEAHAQCKFPARRRWLAERLAIAESDFPAVDCTELTDWRSGIDAGGLTLVFAEAFMNDPSSMFGHTLLRVDPSDPDAGGELLGYSIDFAASTGSDVLPVYIVKGIAGFYAGRFNVRRFYEGLKRYADWENRDIWEYRLDVDPGALDFLLLHLWELKEAELPYYFFSKNCSYELLGLLDVAVPGVDLRHHFPLWVAPADTVRAVREGAGLVEEVDYRPSPETELRHRLEQLSAEERDWVDAIVERGLGPNGVAVDELPPSRAAAILEVAYDRLRYEYLRGSIREEDSRRTSYQVLAARSRIEVTPADSLAPIVAPETSPDRGHATARFSVAAGWRDDEVFVDLALRPALHALIDDSRGYRDDMELRILDTRMRIYPESGRVRLQELTLIGASSLSPRSRVFRPWSWRFGTGLATRRVPGTRGLDDASVWRTDVAGGVSFDPLPGTLVYGLADLRLDVGSEMEDEVSFGPGLRLGVFLAAGRRGTVELFADVDFFVAGDQTTGASGGARFRYSTSRNTAVVVEGTGNHLYDETWAEGALRLHYYF